MYRFPEPNSFEAWERPIVIAKSTKRAMRNKSVLLAWAVSTAVVLVLAYFAMTAYKGTSLFLLWPGALAVCAPMYLYRRKVIRKLVYKRSRLRVRSKSEESPSDAWPFFQADLPATVRSTEVKRQVA